MKAEDKERTIAAYNLFAEAFSKKFSAPNAALGGYLSSFCAELKGPRVLDIGAGDGTAALILQERGVSPVCIDLSPAMVQIMERRGLDARTMDMEKIDFADQSFDGVLALSSLMNLPKADLPKVIENISRVLTPGGVFASFITKGEGEGMETDARYEGTERWFSHYSFEELSAMFSPYFEILVMQDAPTPARAWIFTLCKKR